MNDSSSINIRWIEQMVQRWHSRCDGQAMRDVKDETDDVRIWEDRHST